MLAGWTLADSIFNRQRQLQPPGRPTLSQVREVRLRLAQIRRHHVFEHNMKARSCARQSKAAASHPGPDNSDPANLKRRLKRSRLVHFLLALLATAVITDS